MNDFDDDWGRPVANNGEYARPENLQGHLLIVFPLGYVPHIQTKFTQPGKKSDAICCDIVDLDDRDEAGNPGKIYRTSNLMQAKIIQDLKPFIGRKVLGRIGKGVSKNGMNPPWEITDMSGDEGLMNRARAWAQASPNFVKSTFTERTDAPVAAAPQFQQPGYGQGYGQPQPQGYGYEQYGQPQRPPQQPQFQQAGQYQEPSYAPPQGQFPAQPQYPQQPQYQSYDNGGYNAPPPQQQQPQRQYVAVDGSRELTNEERSVLDRMREQQALRAGNVDAQRAQQGFNDQPPF